VGTWRCGEKRKRKGFKMRKEKRNRVTVHSSVSPLPILGSSGKILAVRR
jgi:hypothetical protein